MMVKRAFKDIASLGWANLIGHKGATRRIVIKEHREVAVEERDCLLLHQAKRPKGAQSREEPGITILFNNALNTKFISIYLRYGWEISTAYNAKLSGFQIPC